MSSTPQSYFKYRPLYSYESSGREPHAYTARLIRDRSLWFAVPSEFNDPFDCNLKLHADDSTDQEWERHIERLGLKYPSKVKNLEIVKKKKLWKTEPALSQDIGRSIHEIHQQSSVCCFSKMGNSITMFSYYADCHRGIAVEFSFADTDTPCGIAYSDTNHRGTPFGGKVTFGDATYPMDFPELNYHRLYDSDQMVKNLIFVKHHGWAHENEYRVFRRRVAASSVVFDPRLVKRVIFGCRTGTDEVNLVKGWLSAWPSDVVLSKAKETTRQFSLEVEDFEILTGAGSP